jgi:hypothetical protein
MKCQTELVEVGSLIGKPTSRFRQAQPDRVFCFLAESPVSGTLRKRIYPPQKIIVHLMPNA